MGRSKMPASLQERLPEAERPKLAMVKWWHGSSSASPAQEIDSAAQRRCHAPGRGCDRNSQFPTDTF
jgi:hypothetical protein